MNKLQEITQGKLNKEERLKKDKIINQHRRDWVVGHIAPLLASILRWDKVISLLRGMDDIFMINGMDPNNKIKKGDNVKCIWHRSCALTIGGHVDPLGKGIWWPTFEIGFNTGGHGHESDARYPLRMYIGAMDWPVHYAGSALKPVWFDLPPLGVDLEAWLEERIMAGIEHWLNKFDKYHAQNCNVPLEFPDALTGKLPQGVSVSNCVHVENSDRAFLDTLLKASSTALRSDHGDMVISYGDLTNIIFPRLEEDESPYVDTVQWCIDLMDKQDACFIHFQ